MKKKYLVCAITIEIRLKKSHTILMILYIMYIYSESRSIFRILSFWIGCDSKCFCFKCISVFHIISRMKSAKTGTVGAQWKTDYLLTIMSSKGSRYCEFQRICDYSLATDYFYLRWKYFLMIKSSTNSFTIEFWDACVKGRKENV